MLELKEKFGVDQSHEALSSGDHEQRQVSCCYHAEVSRQGGWCAIFAAAVAKKSHLK